MLCRTIFDGEKRRRSEVVINVESCTASGDSEATVAVMRATLDVTVYSTVLIVGS